MEERIDKMASEELKEWDISICGLNCAKCPIYDASHGNDKLREELAVHFGGKPESIICEGCRSEPLSHDAHWSPECKMLLCAKEKKVQYCFECKDFPCTILIEFSSDGVPHHKRTVENLNRMKEIGLEAWIAEREKNGKPSFCP